MIRADQLQIGDYVLVSGTPRKVESITKNKIGYHINPQTDKRLYYARLHDVEPIEVRKISIESPSDVVLNDKFLVSANMLACGRSDKVNIDFNEGDMSFYTPFYLHDFFNVVRSGCDKDATLEIMKDE